MFSLLCRGTHLLAAGVSPKLAGRLNTPLQLDRHHILNSVEKLNTLALLQVPLLEFLGLMGLKLWPEEMRDRIHSNGLLDPASGTKRDAQTPLIHCEAILVASDGLAKNLDKEDLEDEFHDHNDDEVDVVEDTTKEPVLVLKFAGCDLIEKSHHDKDVEEACVVLSVITASDTTVVKHSLTCGGTRDSGAHPVVGFGIVEKVLASEHGQEDN